MKILVLDASPDVRAAVRDAIRRAALAGAEALEVDDPRDALNLLRNEKLEIALVIADGDAPGVDGPAFIKQVRTVAPYRQIPVLMTAGAASQDRLAEALRWGARDYLVKPFAPEALAQKLRALRASLEARKNEDTTVMLRMIVQASQPAGDLPFLSRLPAEIAQGFREAAAVSRHAPGDVILRKGQEVEAFLVVLDGEIDLLDTDGTRVLDILETGECVGERAFMSGTAFPMTARARTAAAVGTLSRSGLADLVRRFPDFRMHLASLLARPSAAPPKPAEGGLSGGLKTVPIADLVQVLVVTRKTGVLALIQGAQQAGIFFDRGEIRHAWVDALVGEEAFRALLQWTDAAFTFRSGERSDQVTIEVPTMSLLPPRPSK